MSETPSWQPPQPPRRDTWSPPAPPNSGAPGWTSGGWTPSAPPPGGPNFPRPALRPGPIPLRPLGLGEILDGAISVIRSSPKVMLGLSAVVAFSSSALGFLIGEALRLAIGDTADLSSSSADVTEAASQLVLSGPSWLFGQIAVILLTGILTFAVSRAVLGEQLAIGTSWQGARPRLPALLLASLLLFVSIAIALAVTLAPAGLLALGGGNTGLLVAAAVLGVLVAIPLMVYLAFMFAVASPVIVLEERGVVAGLRRTARLLRGVWWRAFGIWLLINIMTKLLGFVLALPFGILIVVVGVTPAGNSPTLISGLSAVADAVGSAILWPFAAAATALLYLDIRMRREGLDLALNRAVTGSAPAPAAPTAPPYGSLPGFPGPQPPGGPGFPS